ncbi:hypothetical protein GCM10010313_82000 [Streptomyces violarus]|nr:hypothetical protein GCM10010313_82000 [Streptomyces violarus]
MTTADAGFMPGIELSQVLSEEVLRPLLGDVFAGGRLRNGNSAETAVPAVLQEHFRRCSRKGGADDR